MFNFWKKNKREEKIKKDVECRPTVNLAKKVDEAVVEAEAEITGMQRKINHICTLLDSDDGVEEAYSQIEKYVEGGRRILYSVISDHIYQLMNNDATGRLPRFQTNTVRLLDYALGKGDNQMYNVCVKIHDHSNLAIKQYMALRQSGDEYNKEFARNIEPFKNELTKEMNERVLTLLGIFTALAFMIFGGISSLDNLFTEMNFLPILKLIMLGSIWGLAIINLVFVFLICVSKMTKLSFESTDDPKARLIEKYPVVWFSNLMLAMILIGSMGLYYIDKYNLGGWFIDWTKRDPCGFIVKGTILFLIVFAIGIWAIFRKWRK